MRGSVTFSRFAIEGQVPGNYREEFPGRIRRYGFRDLDEHSDQERSAGWVDILDPLDAEFLGEGFFKEGYVALGLRVDIRVVPAKVLRHHSLMAERELARREGLSFLPKERRKELREQVRWKLIRRVIPKSTVYDLVWNLDAGSAILGSTQPAICDLFAEHFQKTFGLQAIPLHPHEMMLRAAGRRGWDPQRISKIQPWSLPRE